jgi:hypothetical protein
MNTEKVWGARYTLGARYLSKNTVIIYAIISFFHKLICYSDPHLLLKKCLWGKSDVIVP